MKQCEECGNTIQDGAAFCANCGAAVSSSGATPIPDASAATATEASVIPGAISPTLPVGATMQAEKPKKKIDGKTIAMIAAIAISLVVGITGIVMAITSNNNGPKPAPISGNEDNGGNNGGSGSGSEGKLGKNIVYAGYEFVIPDRYDYQIKVDEGIEALMYTDDPVSYKAQMAYMNDMTFASIENNMQQLADYFSEKYGVTVVPEINTVGGIKFIYFKIDLNGSDGGLIAFSEADLYYFTTAIQVNGSLDATQYLSNAAEILNSARKITSDRAINWDNYNTISLPKLDLKN